MLPPTYERIDLERQQLIHHDSELAGVRRCSMLFLALVVIIWLSIALSLLPCVVERESFSSCTEPWLLSNSVYLSLLFFVLLWSLLNGCRDDNDTRDTWQCGCLQLKNRSTCCFQFISICDE